MMTSSIKAIIIDDLHLTALNEQNKVYIAKWLKSFLEQGKQVVLTSAYPPKNLANLETTLGIQLSQGWVVELKAPSAASYKTILNYMLEVRSVMLSEEEVANCFVKPQMPLDAALKNAKRLKIFEKFVPQQDELVTHAKMLENITGVSAEDADAAVTESELAASGPFSPGPETPWGRIGIFSPAGSGRYADFVANGIMRRSKDFKLDGGFEVALRKEYAVDNLLLSAFGIADICDEQGLQGAVIIGPPSSEATAQSRDDFFDVTAHMLESMMIRCSAINYEKMKSPAAYLRIVIDLLR